MREIATGVGRPLRKAGHTRFVSRYTGSVNTSKQKQAQVGRREVGFTQRTPL